MNDSKKSKLFTFGKLENSGSEESISDSTVGEPDSEKDISSKTKENLQELAEKMEKLNSADLKHNSPDDSATAPYDVYKRRINNGSNAAAAQPSPKYGIYSERRNLFGLDQRLPGNWTLQCDCRIKNSDGLTEVDITWAAVNKLLDKEARMLILRPKMFFDKSGFACINCHTPDYRDIKFIWKVATLLREHVNHPYVMYYHSTNTKSNIYMHTPNGEFYKKEENRWVPLDEE